MFAVAVTLTVVPGKMAEFSPFMTANAKASLELEPGCRQFDICSDPARPDEVFLYEIYDDAAAFDTHLQSSHYAAFQDAVGDMIAEKSVKSYTQVSQ